MDLSDDARRCLDRYLKKIRTYLQGCKTVDAEEVERNIVEHIESEFENTTVIISSQELNAVLQKLGSPRQWIPEEEISWWKNLVLRFHSGPEDWRLAYISLAFLIIGFLVFPVFIVFIPASFIVARAALSEATDPEELKSQKWLIYPPLLLIYLFVLFWLLTGPAFALAALICEWQNNICNSYPQFTNEANFWILTTSFVLTFLGIWWLILGIALIKLRIYIPVLFKPFADWFNRKWALTLFLTGIGLMIVFSCFSIMYFIIIT